MSTLLNEQEIAEKIQSLADQIIAGVPDGASLALVGIRSRGEILAQRLEVILQERGVKDLDRGTLDITLYRDDLNSRGAAQPAVRATEIDFDIEDRLLVLVDDVLSTGRSVRAALGALNDLGRPRAVRLAVLIDRQCRELPICADFVGHVAAVPQDNHVQVYFREVDDREEIVVD